MKKITIVCLPDGNKSVRQLSVPRVLVNIILLLSLPVAVLLIWASNNYLELLNNVPESLTLLEQNAQYKNQLITLAGKIDRMNKKVAELKEFETKLKIMVNLDTGKEDTQFLGIGGSDFSLSESGDPSGKSSQKLVSLMHQSLDNLDTEMSVQEQEKTELFEFLENQKSMFSCTPSITPATGWVSSKFGYRISPFTNKKEFHSGMDISSRLGTEIMAPADGVISSVNNSDGLGLHIIINHGYGFQTKYGHLSKACVAKGQAVKRGQKIALMGNTGRSTGPHLHYEVHLNDVPVNPERYILN